MKDVNNSDILDSNKFDAITSDIPKGYYRAVKYRGTDNEVHYKIYGAKDLSFTMPDDIKEVLEITKPFHEYDVRDEWTYKNEVSNAIGEISAIKIGKNEWDVDEGTYESFKDSYEQNENMRRVNNDTRTSSYTSSSYSSSDSSADINPKSYALIIIVLLVIFIKNWWPYCLASIIVLLISIPVYLWAFVKLHCDELKSKIYVFGPTFLIIFLIMLHPIRVTLGYEEAKPKRNSYKTETTSSAKYGYVISDALNVRSGPSASYDIITTLHHGTAVEIVKEGKWAYIYWNGTYGYVNSDYLEKR